MNGLRCLPEYYMPAPSLEFNRSGQHDLLTVKDEVLDLLSLEEAQTLCVLPISRVSNDCICIALIKDGDHLAKIDLLSHRWCCVIVPEYIEAELLLRSIDHAYASKEKQSIDLQSEEGEAPVMRYVSWVIEQAAEKGASDIHFEPMEGEVRLRFRIDGELIPFSGPSFYLWSSVLSRVKLLAGLVIDEKRYPQDGRIPFSHNGADWDIRVSTLPGMWGEGLVMRLLTRAALPDSLDVLGMEIDHEIAVGSMLSVSHGLVLATGPTGSGKTTTLYTLLKRFDPIEKKIITVEDPVEYRLDYVNQIPVRTELGLTFAKHLRAILRQAPDVILIGEIRDRETAQIALNASMTGHMVLSSLHTLDTVGAIARLLDLGIEPFLIASVLRGVIAQRLVRRLCSSCSIPSDTTPYERQQMQDLGRALGRIYRPDGCEACGYQGFVGRLGVFECLVVNDHIRSHIDVMTPVHAFRSAVKDRGVRTLFLDGLAKVERGMTTLEELIGISAQW